MAVVARTEKDVELLDRLMRAEAEGSSLSLVLCIVYFKEVIL
ncbi:hypothetical protein [Virgibacillus sp. SK37]|nr:hypothetical protein [Virgibacillus sp. SK37]AIF45611.1 hypothetical protein X953_17550 [Virgibacillus sp. SK37]